jgi:bifunctional oligoribonuclease and PAP phosphatase NrnA
MNQIEILKQRISSANNILITTHTGPDGDAVGSSLGFYHYLNNKCKNVKVVVPTVVPGFLTWLSLSELILVHEKKREESEAAARDADLIICLDFNETKRAGRYQSLIDDSSAYKVLIDHHLGEPQWPDLNLSVVGASSTCELVFDVLYELEGRSMDFLTRELAECIYTGLLTDTGNFQFSATTPKVHLLAAHLMEAGVKPDEVHNFVNNSFTENRLKFFGYCINKKLKFVNDKKLAYMFVSSKELKEFNIQAGGTEGLVNEPMKIESVDISVLFKQDEDRIKISFRSKRDIDVSKFASKYFEGGGHLNASGGVSFESMQETERKFLANLAEHNF